MSQETRVFLDSCLKGANEKIAYKLLYKRFLILLYPLVVFLYYNAIAPILVATPAVTATLTCVTGSKGKIGVMVNE